MPGTRPDRFDKAVAGRAYNSAGSPDRSQTERRSIVSAHRSLTTAQLLVQCLESEGVEYVFGIPGEENIRLVDAMKDSHIRFITVRGERAASFMADWYGRVTGKPGVCAATLGPGAINLLLGTAVALTSSALLVAISAQVGLNRIHKETHQIIDVLSVFK